MLKEICKYLQQTPEVLEDVVQYIKAFATGLKILENIFRLLAHASKCQRLKSSLIKHYKEVWKC